MLMLEGERGAIVTIYDNYMYLGFFLLNRFISVMLYAWGLKSAI